MTPTRAVVAVVNFVGETTYSILENAKGSIAPVLLSGMGSWLLGMNLMPGLLLGAVGQTSYFTALRPINRWVQRNTADSGRLPTDPDKITPRARDAFVCFGTLVAWIAPALLTSMLLPRVAGYVLPHLPERIAFDPANFDWRWATLANVSPLAVHVVVEILYQEKLLGENRHQQKVLSDALRNR